MLSDEMVRVWLTHAQTGGGLDLAPEHAAELLSEVIRLREEHAALGRFLTQIGSYDLARLEEAHARVVVETEMSDSAKGEDT